MVKRNNFQRQTFQKETVQLFLFLRTKETKIIAQSNLLLAFLLVWIISCNARLNRKRGNFYFKFILYAFIRNSLKFRSCLSCLIKTRCFAAAYGTNISPHVCEITSRGENLFDHRLRNVVTLLFWSKNFVTLDPRSHGIFHRIFANDFSSHRSRSLPRSSTTAKLREVGQTMIVRGSRRKSTMFRRSVQLLDAIQYLPLVYFSCSPFG